MGKVSGTSRRALQVWPCWQPGHRCLASRTEKCAFVSKWHSLWYLLCHSYLTNATINLFGFLLRKKLEVLTWPPSSVPASFNCFFRLIRGPPLLSWGTLPWLTRWVHSHLLFSLPIPWTPEPCFSNFNVHANPPGILLKCRSHLTGS